MHTWRIPSHVSENARFDPIGAFALLHTPVAYPLFATFWAVFLATGHTGFYAIGALGTQSPQRSASEAEGANSAVSDQYTHARTHNEIKAVLT